jgi:hypothetical protein
VEGSPSPEVPQSVVDIVSDLDDQSATSVSLMARQSHRGGRGRGRGRSPSSRPSRREAYAHSTERGDSSPLAYSQEPSSTSADMMPRQHRSSDEFRDTLSGNIDPDGDSPARGANWGRGDARRRRRASSRRVVESRPRSALLSSSALMQQADAPQEAAVFHTTGVGGPVAHTSGTVVIMGTHSLGIMPTSQGGGDHGGDIFDADQERDIFDVDLRPYLGYFSHWENRAGYGFLGQSGDSGHPEGGDNGDDDDDDLGLNDDDDDASLSSLSGLEDDERSEKDYSSRHNDRRGGGGHNGGNARYHRVESKQGAGVYDDSDLDEWDLDANADADEYGSDLDLDDDDRDDDRDDGAAAVTRRGDRGDSDSEIDDMTLELGSANGDDPDEDEAFWQQLRDAGIVQKRRRKEKKETEKKDEAVA